MNARQILSTVILAGVALSWTALADAHPQHGLNHGGGNWAGLAHPLLGVDHLLAIVAVGLVSGQLGGRAVWALPATFMVAMLIGGALGMAGIGLPLVEQGIALSILVFGGVLLMGRKTPPLAAMTVVALFAMLHGQAHGSEMPELAQPFWYGLGFLLSTAALLGLGVLAAHLALKYREGFAGLRLSGAAIAVVGLALLVGA